MSINEGYTARTQTLPIANVRKYNILNADVLENKVAGFEENASAS